MSSKKRNCFKKKSYDCILEAFLKAAYYYKHNRLKQKPYLCEICGKYHLTTEKQWLINH